MRRALILLPAALLLGGCEGIQSMLAPSGLEAEKVATLTWVIFIGAGLIMALVILLTIYAMVAPGGWRRWAASHGFIIGGGIVFPIVTLTALLIYGLVLMGGARGSSESASPALKLDVTGEQFWWRVRYEGQEGGPDIESANEVHIPVGRPVELRLHTADVIHSFWVPQLAGKLDMIPGQVNTLILRAVTPGLYRGQCTEYCGIQHANMAFYVVAHEEEAFQRWLRERAEPAREPLAELLRQGQSLFIQAGCGSCHAVRGTEANGKIGPDLTHVGSRQSIGAGILPNNAGTIAAWIASSQHLKPGNKMPSFDVLEGVELRAIATYLESLK